ncbi:expressed unknown protein [Ectocarpus siliculosus]|uniref:Uncharacterized protein n=1 Tax=Ectocarpus siliculosus TaxID=2880 RepID=D8LLT4_ECTSI|nr:expressed unknown protein [Ectocarpus siliculosus]|eukprot:CBN76170.1 expressed unknown protein [Ectocarpus siliculosus]
MPIKVMKRRLHELGANPARLAACLEKGRPLEAEGTAAGVALAGEGLAVELPLLLQGRQAAVDDHGGPGKNALDGFHQDGLVWHFEDNHRFVKVSNYPALEVERDEKSWGWRLVNAHVTFKQERAVPP